MAWLLVERVVWKVGTGSLSLSWWGVVAWNENEKRKYLENDKGEKRKEREKEAEQRSQKLKVHNKVK